MTAKCTRHVKTLGVWSFSVMCGDMPWSLSATLGVSISVVCSDIPWGLSLTTSLVACRGSPDPPLTGR